MSPRGRRPAGSPDAREAIVAAARTAFARDGYSASLRGVARQAGVDPALVHHYFPQRALLFVAAVVVDDEGKSIDFRDLADGLTRMSPECAGEEFVRHFLTVWDADSGVRFAAMARVAMSDDAAVADLHAYVSDSLIEPIVRQYTSDRPLLRAQLIAGQMIGLGVTRWITGLSSIKGAGVEELVVLVGPTIQRYLLGELPDR